MTITNGYCTEAELMSELSGAVVATETAKTERAINAASRLIDAHTGWDAHGFWIDPTAQTRLYIADDYYCLCIPEGIATLTGLVVKLDDGANGTYTRTLVINTDFAVDPPNALADGRPVTEIRLINGALFPIASYLVPGVQIAAKFGWPAVPDAIKEACLFQAATMLKSAGAPGGILQLTGLDGIGMRLGKLHPQAAALCEGYTRAYA